MKSKSVAYLFWLLGIFGALGFHRFYLRKFGTGFLWLVTGGFFGFGALIDLFTLGGHVEQYNTNLELKALRATTQAIVNTHYKSALDANVKKKSDDDSTYKAVGIAFFALIVFWGTKVFFFDGIVSEKVDETNHAEKLQEASHR